MLPKSTVTLVLKKAGLIGLLLPLYPNMKATLQTHGT